ERVSLESVAPSEANGHALAAKAATIRDVAERAKVSVASVSRVLNRSESISEVTRQRVLDAVEHLRYVPHVGARSLSTSRTDTFGVILPDLFGEFFSELIRGMDLAARSHGKHLIVSSSHGDTEETLSALRSMRGRVDGMIVLSPHVRAANLAADVAGRTPVVLMNGGLDEVGRPSIAIDNLGAAEAAVAHLIASGRSRIAHIRGAAGNLEADIRAQGYEQAIKGQAAIVVEGDFSQASGHRAATALLAQSPRPDAIFAANDMMALGALLAIQEAGLRCPEDIALVGFDDIPLASGVERLLGLVQAGANADAQNDCEIVRPILVARQSTAAASTAGLNP
ncbi:hypothetical protein LTR94_026996, partial [Friedmanniomyces endolithicus]